ncbi:MAG TPA: T9SS type A sorting domain-containing protein [Flavobacteriales bacterium]|nr:T9SS type A sorting domain-containing protein [Flavobacteriales bacterium]
MHPPTLRSALAGSLFVLAFLSRAQTTLFPGDLAVIGINANNNCAPWPSQSDEFSFVIFKDVVNGTTIDITDNGYERTTAGLWGDSEGVFRLTRSGGTLLKGTVITVQRNGTTNVITCTGWTVNTTVVSPAVGVFDMNSGGEQIFFCQGGTWTNPAGAHNMSYSGTVLYGFSTVAAPNDWVSFQNSTQRSGLPPGMICFSMSPTATGDFTKYVPFEFSPGPIISRTQRQWLIDIDDQIRWNSYPSCSAYNTPNSAGPSNTWSPNWAAPGATLGNVVAPANAAPITAGGFVNGRWTGAKSTDWFDCRNWDDAEVPIATSNVLINPIYANVNNCVIGVTASPPTAVCASLTVQTSGIARLLTIQNSGVLQVGGGITVQNTGAVAGFNGIVMGNVATDGSITATGLTLSGNGTYKGGFRNEQSGNSVAIAGNITINAGGYLDLQGGATGGSVSLTGNWSNNDAVTAFDEVGSNVIFNGTGPQSVNTSGFQEEFGYLTLNKGGNDLTLNAPALVKSTLTMTSGRLMTSDPNGLLSLANTASIFGANDAAPSFVHGPMVKIGATAFTFPIGKGTRLHPASISNLAAGATDAFIAEYFAADPTVDIGTPIETPPLDHISTCEYWRVDQYAGSPLGRVTLSWKQPMSCGVTNLADLRVAHWDDVAGMWMDEGNGGAAGSFLIGTIPQADPQETSFSTGFWTLASISLDNPLPIELISFDARADGDQVRLDWITASERDNDFFTVERSANGIDFSEVLRVDGAGNSTTTLVYQDYDHWPLPGTSYYRLRQTDLDGTFSYSPAVPVVFGGLAERPLIVFGNSDVITAVHGFPSGSRYALLDMTGRIIAEGSTTMDNRTEFNVSGLSPGAYAVRLVNGDRSESTRFVY